MIWSFLILRLHKLAEFQVELLRVVVQKALNNLKQKLSEVGMGSDRFEWFEAKAVRSSFGFVQV